VTATTKRLEAILDGKEPPKKQHPSKRQRTSEQARTSMGPSSNHGTGASRIQHRKDVGGNIQQRPVGSKRTDASARRPCSSKRSNDVLAVQSLSDVAGFQRKPLEVATSITGAPFPKKKPIRPKPNSVALRPNLDLPREVSKTSACSVDDRPELAAESGDRLPIPSSSRRQAINLKICSRRPSSITARNSVTNEGRESIIQRQRRIMIDMNSDPRSTTASTPDAHSVDSQRQLQADALNGLLALPPPPADTVNADLSAGTVDGEVRADSPASHSAERRSSSVLQAPVAVNSNVAALPRNGGPTTARTRTTGAGRALGSVLQDIPKPSTSGTGSRYQTNSRKRSNDNFIRLNLRNAAGSCRGARNKKAHRKSSFRNKSRFGDDGSTRGDKATSSVRINQSQQTGTDPLDDYLDGVYGSNNDSDKSGDKFKQQKQQLRKDKLTKGNPLPLCTGHQRPCKLLTVKKSGDNKGRKFYACPLPRGEQCNHFQWADDTVQVCSMHSERPFFPIPKRRNRTNTFFSSFSRPARPCSRILLLRALSHDRYRRIWIKSNA